MNTGASSDIERATSIARKMVCEWGMSDKLGPIAYKTSDEHVFLGRDFGKPREHSESTQIDIDNEVKSILDTAYTRAKDILDTNLDVLHALAQAVLEKETLDADDIERIISGGGRNSGPGGGPGGGSSDNSEENSKNKSISEAA